MRGQGRAGPEAPRLDGEPQGNSDLAKPVLPASLQGTYRGETILRVTQET